MDREVEDAAAVKLLRDRFRLGWVILLLATVNAIGWAAFSFQSSRIDQLQRDNSDHVTPAENL